MTLSIGWIGCGKHANEMLLPQLVRYKARIAALCDSDPTRLAETAARHGVGATYADYRDLIAHKNLDAIGMAIGPNQHPPMALAALARGLPVFMEKPPAADVASAEEVRRAADAASKPVVVGFMKRYASGYRIAGNLLAAPEFGPRLGLMAEYMTAPTYFVGDPDYTGFYLHHCVHFMDLVPWLMGTVREIRTRRHEAAPGKLLLHVDFEFEGGALGTLALGTIRARSTPMEWVQVSGDHRRIEVRNVTEVRYYRNPSFKVSDPAATLTDTADTLTWEPNPTVAANEDHKGYHAILGAFIDAVAGRPSDAPTIADGVAALRLLTAMIASGETGQPVRL